jgi:hypothetical protein
MISMRMENAADCDLASQCRPSKKKWQETKRFLTIIQHLSWLGRQDSNLGMAESKSYI